MAASEGYANNDFFVEQASTNAFVKIDFKDAKGQVFTSGAIQLVAATQAMQYSFDGVNQHGRLAAGESINFIGRLRRAIWIKSHVADTPGTMRVHAW